MSMVTQSKRVAPEVLYATQPVATVGMQDVDELKELALTNPRGRMRLCLHPSVQHRLHEMLIVQCKNTYVRPHKHVAKAESLLVLEGEVDVVLFDEDGSPMTVAHLSNPAGDDGLFYHRINESLYHTLIIRSETLVFHEITSGPFRRADTIFAPWAPVEDDATVRPYLDSLKQSINTLEPCEENTF